MRLSALPVCFAFAALGGCRSGGSAPGTPPDPFSGIETILEENLRVHAEYLGAEARRGRETGTEGCRDAGSYVAALLHRAGLLPGGEFGTYFQHYLASSDRGGRRPAENVVATLPGRGRQRDQWIVLTAALDGPPRLEGGSAPGDPPRLQDGERQGDAPGATLGPAWLLEVARVCADREGGWNRSLLFLALSGSHQKCSGAYHYLDHAVVPLEEVVQSLHFDGERLGSPETCTVRGCAPGSAEAALATQLAPRFAPDLRLELAGELDAPTSASAFASRGVATLAFPRRPPGFPRPDPGPIAAAEVDSTDFGSTDADSTKNGPTHNDSVKGGPTDVGSSGEAAEPPSPAEQIARLAYALLVELDRRVTPPEPATDR